MAQVFLPLGSFLDPSSIKAELDQLVNNPGDTGKIIFEHFTDEQQQQAIELAVTVLKNNQEYIIEASQLSGTPMPVWIQGVASKIKDLRIRLNSAATQVEEWLIEVESELESFRETVQDELAKIPYRIEIQNLSETKQFHIVQTTPIQGRLNQTKLTLNSSSLTFTSASLGQLSFAGEMEFNALQKTDGQPYIANVSLSYGNNQLTVLAQNFPPAKLHGHDLELQSFQLVLQNNQFMPGTDVQGQVVFHFLDAGAQGPGTVNLNISYQNNGAVLYSAQNPEGQELKKGAISIFFRQFDVLVPPQGSNTVDINGWMQLAGVKDPSTGLPVKTDFSLSYLDPHFTFTGLNFAPLPISFGQLSFTTVLFKVHENGTVVQNNWEGQWHLPSFNQGHLNFSISYVNDQNRTFTIEAQNPQNTPVQMGQLSLTLNMLRLHYQNGLLQDATGTGELVLPHITEADSIATNFRFNRVNQDETILIEASSINGKAIAGADLNLDLVRLTFLNGELDASQIQGHLWFPDATDGAGLAVNMDLSNGGDDYVLTLNGAAQDKLFNFGPVALTFNSFLLTSVNGSITTVTGDGLLLLPGLSNPFAFNFTANPNQNPVSYTINGSNVNASLNGLELNFATIQLVSNQSQPFQFSAQGTLRLPLFTQGSALNFSLTVSRNQTYSISVNAANQLIQFGDFTLNQTAINITVNNGTVATFSGSAQMNLPGFELPVAAALQYTETRDEYIINLQNALQTQLGGLAIELQQFELIITQGDFTSAGGEGNLKLPDATGGAGLDFDFSVLANGSDIDFVLRGNATNKTLEFGPASLDFNAFNASVRLGELAQLSGSGALSLPGLSQAMSFVLLADFSGPQAQYRILVQNLGADFNSFNLQFNQIEITAIEGGTFNANANGTLTLPALSGSPLNFNLTIAHQNNYQINVLGSGQALTYGLVSIEDLNLGLGVINGNVQSANGTALVALSGLSPANEQMAVQVAYSSSPERFQLTINQVFPLEIGPITLSLTNFAFSLLNGAFESGSISGTGQLPVFVGGTSLTFALNLGQNGQDFSGTLQSNGVMSAGSLSLQNLQLDTTISGGQVQSISGSGDFKIGLSNTWMTVQVSYANNQLNFLAQSPPAFTVGGLSFQFHQVGFTLNNGNLTNGNLTGDLIFPGFENGANQLAFAFTLSQGSQYAITINHQSNPVQLSKGDLNLYIRLFSLNVSGTTLQSGSADLDFSIAGLNDPNNPSQPARVTVGAQYQSAADNFRFTLSNTPQLDVGGFSFTLNSLELNLGAGGMQYPFEFDGDLRIPGLQNDQGGNANLEVKFTATAPDTFAGSITANPAPTFEFGSVLLTINQLDVSKNGSRLGLALRGQLELTSFSAMGGDPALFLVDVSIDNQGNFSILGEVPGGNGVKVADVPGVVRLYLSRLGLSQINNTWDFALGGLIENKIVLPGMEELLPSEINLKELSFGSSFDLDMDLRWPSGLSISVGGDATEAIIPVNGRFGQAVSLEALKLSFNQLPNNGGAILGLSFSGATLNLGPVVATVEGLGVEATISKAPVNGQGMPTGPANFGVVNIAVAFKPPEGLGVALNTPVFTGGGYLYFNHDKEEYAGALELSFMDLFAVKAIGLINNKMPDGSPGTSVLFIVSVEFSPGIALGFGFFLSGLGGILGVHRTIQVERLRDGVRTGTIQNILFPQNIIANITQIISDIKEVFPIMRNQFVVGPMAAITWGVPTIVRVDLGLAIEIGSPTKFAILGVLRIVLPDEALALIRLQVAFLGVLDLEQKMLSFDASIFDSKVLTFGLEGDMALRLSWGEKPDFVITLGGFHPSFNPPSHLQLPTLKRLTLKILSGNPRLTLTSYFAVTSNTVQFGAGIDFYFGVAGFKVIGEFGFDVLFQFSPFRFIADARARLAVKAGSTTLLSLSLTFSLEGPIPWRAKGTAKFKILFISVKVRFDETWGEKRETSLPDIAVLPLLEDALNDNQNWRCVTGPNHIDGMRMRAVENDEELILTPNGFIELSQKVVPLAAAISKFGQFNPADYTKFEITTAKVGANTAEVDPVLREFAPANFLAVSDAEKLALPSFEPQQAGVKISANGGLRCGNVKDRQVRYETSVMDEDAQQLSVSQLDTAQAFSAAESTFFSLRGAIGQSSLSAAKRYIVNPAKVHLKKPTYAVVDNDDFAVQGQAQNLSFMEAQELVTSENIFSAGVQIITDDQLSF